MVRIRMAMGWAALLAQCMVAGGSQVVAKESLSRTTAMALNGELAQGYSVAAGDKLRVTVFDEPSLTGEYTIGVGGELAIPLIDVIQASGQTTVALSSWITSLLQQGGYVLAPRVSVEIIEHRPFYILGEVKEPGEYPYSGNLTLEQAVAKAGGYTPRANKGSVLVKRQQSARSVKVRLGREALRIAPGDTITVQEAFF